MPIEVNNLTINSSLSTDDEPTDSHQSSMGEDYAEHIEKLRSEIMEECQQLIKTGLKSMRER
ncbi:MAG TPA: hypothetical protein ENJ08_17875 [Gammaproteobacteria bacterium]|nr:hypothetical protein [Gammaproteobacteria bacterium]